MTKKKQGPKAKASKLAKTTTKRAKTAPTTAPKFAKRPVAPKPPKPPKPPKAPKPPSVVTQRRNALNDKTLPELKALLKRNDQVTTGSKAKLVKRIVACVTDGCFPRCPECGLGRMRSSQYYGLSCPGGFDDDEYMFCGFTAALGEIERPAWQYETPGGLF